MTGGEKGKLQLVAIKAEHEAHPLRFFGWVLLLSIPLAQSELCVGFCRNRRAS